jgi:hypothetical protein
MPAPPGKDAGSKVWLCHIEIRGRRMAVIGARRFGCNVSGRPTSSRARVSQSVAIFASLVSSSRWSERHGVPNTHFYVNLDQRAAACISVVIAGVTPASHFLGGGTASADGSAGMP